MRICGYSCHYQRLEKLFLERWQFYCKSYQKTDQNLEKNTLFKRKVFGGKLKSCLLFFKATFIKEGKVPSLKYLIHGLSVSVNLE